MPRLTQFVAATAAWLLASLCGALAAWLAWHHPLSPAGALLACAVAAGLTAVWPTRWMLWLFPALPLVGLAPWTGWVGVEEFDLLVLAVAAGGQLRVALGAQRPRAPGQTLQGDWLWLLPLLLAVVVGLWRGLESVGEQGFGWWQGVREPLNGLRLAKSLVEVLLLLPLARMAWREDQAVASGRLVLAMVWTLLFAGLGVLWDLMALAGLPAAAAAQRPVTLFWESQLGGGALDAVLTLTLPFAAASLAQAPSLRRALLPAVALLLGVQACLAVGSPLVLLSALLGLALWWCLHVRQQRAASAGLRPGLLGALLVLALSAWLFPVTGMAGVLAMLGVIGLMLPLQGLRGRLAAGPLTWSLVGGTLLAGLLSALAWAVPVAAGPSYALAWAWGAAMLAWVWTRGRPAGVMGAVVATLAVLGAMVAVTLLVGGHAAGLRAAPAALLLGAGFCAVVLRQRTSWPDDLGWQSKLLVSLAAAALVGAWLGAAPLSVRLAAVESTLGQRVDHWRASLALLQSPLDWAIGKGVGSFPAQHAAAAPPAAQGGDVRWLPDDDGGAAQLSSGGLPAGATANAPFSASANAQVGQQLAQRVGVPQASIKDKAQVAVLRLLARSNDKNVGLRASLCADVCAVASSTLGAAARPGQWQSVEMRLTGPLPDAGPWWAPRAVVFALGAQPANVRVQIDQLSLIDGQGVELLDNGGFDGGLARWTTIGDPPFSAWHLQNAAVHLLFEQGLLALLAWVAAVGVALWRLVFGAARQRSLAPPLAAALLGTVLLGLQDSLFDLPRAAFLGGCLLAVALAIADHRQHRRRRERKPRA